MRKKQNIGYFVTLTIITIFLLINLSSAQPVFRTEENVTLRVPCTVNGSFCSVGATCYGTIINPDGFAIINSVLMTKNGSVFELPLGASDKDINGEYEFHILCSDLGNSQAKNLIFFVTPNGELPTTGKGILYGGLLAVFVLLMVLSIMGGFKFQHIALKTASFMVAYLFFVGITFISWNLSLDYLTSSPFITSFFHLVWLVTMIGAFPLGLFMLIYTMWMLRQMDIINNMIDRGMPIDEAYERTVKSGLKGVRA